MTAPDVALRPGGAEDGPELARVFISSRSAAVMPDPVHSEAEIAAWLTDRSGSTEHRETWIAEVEGSVVGYVRLTRTWLDDLYVLPDHQGQGIGSMLLDLAKSIRPGGFSLWVFEMNRPARDFYARHGLVEREHTDGSDNEEQTPDLRMEWPGR